MLSTFDNLRRENKVADEGPTSNDDLESVVLDLQEKVALMSENFESRMSLIAATTKQDKKTAEEGFVDHHRISSTDSENPTAEPGISIDEDIFSLMMTSKVYSLGWVLGLCTFAFQMTLAVILLMGFFKLSKDSTPFNAPIRVSNDVRLGQFFSVILSLLSQQDIYSAMNSLILLRSSSPGNKDSGFYSLLVDDRDDKSNLGAGKECTTWFFRALIPNVLKMIQDISVLFVALIVIIQSDDLIGLLRDFSALYFLSEIDNIMFTVAAQGYFGDNLQARTEKVTNVRIMEDETAKNSCVVHRLSRTVLFVLAASMFFYLGYVVRGQLNGDFVRMKYPNCDFLNLNRKPLDIFDNTCDGILNIAECGFDGGDCEEFNSKYPAGCAVPDTTLVGDGFCNGGRYATIGCGRDGGDCDVCPLVPESDKDTRAVATGDFDNDSSVDIVFGNCGLSNQLLLNNGDASFGNAIDLPGGNRNQCTTSVAAADLDGDGLIDIIVGRKSFVDSGQDSNEILWNNGDGTFIQEKFLNSDKVDTRVIEVVDLNYDSFPEIIFGNSNTAANTIMWNQGNREFNKEEFPESDYYDTRSIVVIQNILGRPSVRFGNYDNQNWYYLVEPGIRILGPDAFCICDKFDDKTIAMATFTTGSPDDIYFVALNEGTDHMTSVVKELGSDVDEEYAFPLLDDEKDMNKARCIKTADMNNEGFVELVTGHGDGEGNRVFFLSTESSSIELPCTSDMNTNAIALADLDNDGNKDIIMGNSMQMNQVLLNFLGSGMEYKQSGNAALQNVWLPENSLTVKYPDCKASNITMIGDGMCDNDDRQNSAACGYDDGDCIEFNLKYPGCKAEYPYRISDGICNTEGDQHNTAACRYDGGDCDDFNTKYPDCEALVASFLGDGECDDSVPYNTEECGYDGGDCDDFNTKYPDCTANKAWFLGDGKCDNEDPYNTEECGYDDGDCLEFNAKYPDCVSELAYTIGNGMCENDYQQNSAACGYDGGDCDDFNAKYPDCAADEYYSYYLGDGECDDFYPYNTEACGYDDGDCE